MRAVVPLLFVLLQACRSDAPGTAPLPAPSPSVAPQAAPSAVLAPPTVDDLLGWWLVEETYKPEGNAPGTTPGSAYFFGKDTVKLLFGDATDKRALGPTRVEGSALMLDLEGSKLLVARRTDGLLVRNDPSDPAVPLRRATELESKGLEHREAKHRKMLERACEKALECCQAAKAKKLANDDDCKPLLTAPELHRCIHAVSVLKRKAAEAKIALKECLPDP